MHNIHPGPFDPYAGYYNKNNGEKMGIYLNKYPYRGFFKVIRGKHGIYNGGKVNNFEIPFLARKIYQYWIRIYQKMRNSYIWGGMFSNKSIFCRHFHEKIRILDFWDYDGVPLKSQKSKTLICSWKCWQYSMIDGIPSLIDCIQFSSNDRIHCLDFIILFLFSKYHQ